MVASSQLCGISGIFYYAKQMFISITQNNVLLSQQLMVGLSSCQLIACLVANRLIDPFGRRFIILWGQRLLIMILGLIFVVDNIEDILS